MLHFLPSLVYYPIALFFSVNAMAKTFAILAQGSAFMHGSNTSNGGAADVRINDLFGYVAYQVCILSRDVQLSVICARSTWLFGPYTKLLTRMLLINSKQLQSDNNNESFITLAKVENNPLYTLFFATIV